MKARLAVGCASWADKSFVASGWYPPECRTSEDRLRYYASRFSVVEVDSSYYALPSERNARLWSDRTPADFTFHVKAFRLLTGHWTPPAVLPPDIKGALPRAQQSASRLFYKDVPRELRDELWKRFKEALRPLSASNKLGVVLFQFPSTVVPHPKVFAHIEECRERLAPYDPAIEFRNRAWFAGEQARSTFDFLRSRRLSFVAVDEPQGFDSSVPPLIEVTGPFAIIRFHGRNAETWEKKGLASSAARFNHYYAPEELSEWVEVIRDLLEAGEAAVHAIMNTNWGDQGPVNALLLAGLLGGDAPRLGPRDDDERPPGEGRPDETRPDEARADEGHPDEGRADQTRGS